jgi:hypothetical protein
VSQRIILCPYSPKETGCWFDSSRGIYIGEAVIELAESHGFRIQSKDRKNRNPTGEFYSELWDEAEDYMEQFAPLGFFFGSNESGDWGLWEEEDGE